jgi:hypothetical protein
MSRLPENDKQILNKADEKSKPRSFPYEPLDQSIDSIRLVLLQPGKGEDIIDCQLIHVTFASKPNYVALSYTWGKAECPKPILVNGKKMTVQRNLYKAFQGLRSMTEVRMLWADAICINQSDLEERNYQVELMAFVYTRAQAVVVWLGSHDPSNDDSSNKNQGAYRIHDPLEDNSIKKSISLDPYWERIWIVQEIGLARSLSVTWTHGESVNSYSWHWFAHSLQAEKPGGQLTWEAEKALQRPQKLFKLREGRHGDTNRLEQLIEDFADSQCSELHDKIYGFLGLANDCQGGSLKVDYSKTAAQLYEEVIRFQYHAEPLPGSLPSAIDRPMRLVRFSQLVQQLFSGLVNDEAIKRTPRSLDAEFSVRGVILGTVLFVGGSYEDIVSSFKANREWKASIGKLYTTAGDLRRLREMDERYTVKLLEMEQAALTKFYCIQSKVSKGTKVLETWLTSGPSTGDHRKGELSISSSGIRTSGNPRRFLASHSVMGLAPPEIREGDVICGFWGCDVQVVMRQDDDKGNFRIVGRAGIAEGSKEYSGHEGIMNIQMDIETLQILTR